MSQQINDNDAAMELFKSRLTERIAPKGYYGFDPTIIISILAAIVQALQGACPKPTPNQVKRGGIFVRARALAALGNQFPHMSLRERRDLNDDIFAVAASSKENEISDFMKACSS